MNQGNNLLKTAFVINVKEVLWRLLEQWKAICLFAFCVMLLFSGIMQARYSLYNQKNNQIQAESKVLTEEDIINSLPENEQEFVLSVYHLFQERERLSEYINTAPIMQMDPNHLNRLRFRWALEGTGQDLNTLAMSYVMELADVSHRSSLLQASGVDLAEEQFNDLLFFTFPDEIGHNVICCDLFLTADMQENSLQEEFADELEKVHAKLQDELGEHQIRNYNSEVTVVSDEHVLKQQTDIFQSFTNISVQINNMNNLFSATQKDAFIQLKSLGQTIQVDDQTQIAPKTLSLRIVFIGLFLGVIVYVMIYLFYIVLSNIIISSDALEDSSVRTLGEWHEFFSTKSSILIRDRTIWKRHHRNHLDRETELNRITNSVKSICGYRQIDELLIVMTGEQSEAQDSFVQSFVKNMKRHSINVKTMKVNNSEGVINEKELIDVDGAMLFIVEGKTRRKDLEVVFDRCNEYNQSIIGSVYLG